MAIPRIGHEVIVDFLEGDPDQPIITGRTYHQNNKPPYPLPDNKTITTIKSQTHKGSGFNELRFEDEANKEEIFIHAQRDTNLVTRNNKTDTIGNSKFVQIVKNLNTTTGLFSNHFVGMSYYLTAQMNITLTCFDNFVISSGDDTTIDSGRNLNAKASNSINLHSMDLFNINSQGDSVQNSKGMIYVQSQEFIKMICGASSIEINKNKISIKSPKIELN